MFERLSVLYILGIEAVDRLDFAEREIFFADAGGTDGALHHVAGLEAVCAYLLLGDIYVVGTAQVVVVAGTEESVSVGHYFEKTVCGDDAG